MRRLFDESDRWTKDAEELGREFWKALHPLVSDYHLTRGFSVRDIENVLVHEIGMACSLIMIRTALVKPKAGGEPK